jgi:hypothetical protein
VPAVWATTVVDTLFVLALPATYLALLGAWVHGSRRPRLAALRAGAVTLSIVLALAALELAAAARLVHWEVVFAVVAGEPQDYVPDGDLGFRHTPNARWVGRPRSDIETAWGLPASRSDRITITYDARGYRNPTPLVRADIVLIGDSYVEGKYVSDDETVAAVLQERLGRPVANLGVAGYGTTQELRVLATDALRLEPKVVLWFFFEGNDLYNDDLFDITMQAWRDGRAPTLTGAHGWWRRSLVRNLHDRLRVALGRLVPRHYPYVGTVTAGPRRGQTVLFWPETAPWTEFERRRWERARRTLDEGARLTRDRGVRLLLVYVPTKFRVYRDHVAVPPQSAMSDWNLWPLPGMFADFCRARGVACLDLTPVLRESVRRGGMPHAVADSHWSPEGHRLVAEALLDRLRMLGWIDASGGARRGRSTGWVTMRRQENRISNPNARARHGEVDPQG